MNIQDIKSNTTWQEASNTINNNNNKISLAIATLENAKLKNKGYFTTLEKLNEAVPNPTIGSKAYVGTSEPYAIYIVENGVWVDSGYTGGDEIVAKITTDRIADGAVTTEKIATSAFDSTLSVSGKIAPADVVGGKLTELEVITNARITTDRIENGAVTSEKIATSAFDSTLSVSGKIAPADVVGEKLTGLEKETNVLSGLKECFNIIDNPNLFDGVTDFETSSSIGSAIVDLYDCTLHYRNGNNNAGIAIPLKTELGKEYKLSFKSDFVITGQNTYAGIAEYIWASSGRFATVDTTDNNNNHVTFVARSTTTYFVIGVAWTIKEYTISELSCYRTDVEPITIKFEKLDNKPYETPKIKARNLLGHGVIYEGKIIGTNGELLTNEYYNTIELDLTGIEGSLWGHYRTHLDDLYVRDYLVSLAFKVGESWQYIENDDWNKPIKAENQTQGFIQIPSGCTIARVSYSSDIHLTTYDPIISGTWLAQSRTDYMSYEPIKEKTEYPIKSKKWYNKTMLAFGDSITAINNGNSNCIGYARFICDYFGIDKYYGRGIGSSCVAWHESPIWFSAADGQYLGREESQRPSGTEGVDYWSHKYEDNKPSSYCSWDRIKTMIPDSIKDEVDLIFVMGGTNDHMSNKPLGEGNPTWSQSNVQDTVWMADTAYNGGDFDLSTFKGGLASTLMKIQKRCPNAVILFGTLIGGYNSVNNPKTNGLGLTPRQYADASIEVCKMLSIPYVDVFTLAGINNFNNDVYLPTDKVHPYCKDGGKALASAIITGMENCPIKVDW